MVDAKAYPRSPVALSLQDRVARGFVLLYQALGLAGFALLPVLAYNRVGTPFERGFAVPYGTGLFYLSSSLWVLFSRREEPAARAFSLFATSAALALAGLAEGSGSLPASLRAIPAVVAAGALLDLATRFPQEARFASRFPLLRWLVYLPAGWLSINGLLSWFDPAYATDALTALRGGNVYAGAAGAIFLSWMIWQRHASPSPVARSQARALLWGAALALGPLVAWLLRRILQPDASYSDLLLLPLGIFPLVAGYTVLRYRLLDLDERISQGVVYAALSVLAAASYALLVAGLSLVFSPRLAATNPVVIGLFILGLAVALDPARQYLQRSVDRIFFRGRRAYESRLQQFRHEITHAVELPAVLRLSRRHIEDTLAPTRLHIFILDPLSDQYMAAVDEHGRSTSDLRFSAASPLALTLSRRGAAIYMDQTVTMPRALQSDWARMALLGAQLFIPLPGRNQLTGWLSLGPRRSRERYSDRELAFLESLCEQAAVAIERAQVVGDLERRIHEMNVLTRVAQGVNITLAYDDILELIYAQTHQVLPLDDFHITLANRTTGSLYHAFYLEDNERLGDRENQPLPERQGLVGEVIQTGQGLISDDYERDCRSRAILPATRGVFAWMGVPLNTGAETMGAACLASRDPSVIYTDEGRDFLQAIADQAAGAIAKARLLQETERRARQLASLNEVAHSLASTLELDPLLSRILQGAVDILNCEAGSLFLVDETTDELVFKVTSGPVASDLIGQRLPPGTGLAGKAVISRQPLISNDVQLSEEWSGQTDQQTGFLTRAVLVVPLQVKDRIIGVIEVINKRDGLPFVEDDQELLTVFTGQAAVAVENARLYTLTDQALAARVAELSVMQRVDRELNTSLDMRHAMEITLDWAMRQSGSEAGFVSVLAEGELDIIAEQGYPTEIKNSAMAERALEIPAIRTAIASGSPCVVQADSNGGGPAGLAGGQCQAAIPIRREAEVIAILLLESSAPEHFKEETLGFLNRLSDHAAIAISNAQLYAEVQAANIAKSDFVSFVSHELKTPMTSIKGYADLLANSAVGPINDAQANFLSTIRSNVNRMATLVSDLTDISRIEAGRLHLEFSEVSVSEVVEEVQRSSQQQIDEHEQALSLEIPPDLPPVWGDRTRLIQVLTNLSSNANKYTPKNGRIVIRAEATANTWDPGGAPHVVHISVHDNGIGISAEDQARIFQKFFRSEDQKAREVPGTGLGLNITKYLVEMQGGRIWFESEFRVGTTFHFTIPTVETEA